MSMGEHIMDNYDLSNATLINLIGSNPLPNYIAIKQFKPQIVIGVYSKQTKNVWGNIKRQLNKEIPELKFENRFLDNANDPDEIKSLANSILQDNTDDIWLHYTGGTKCMSAIFSKVFLANSNREKRHFYLDELHQETKKATFVFSNSKASNRNEVEVNLDLSLDEIAAIHGVEPKINEAKQDIFEEFKNSNFDELCRNLYKFYKNANENDKKSILGFLGKIKEKQNDESLKLLIQEHEKLSKSEMYQNLVPEKVNSYIHEILHNSDGRDKKARALKGVGHFFHGTWLEELFLKALQTWNKKHENGFAFKHSIEFRPLADKSRKAFEIDVLAIKGHRLWAVSCTTDTTRSLNKSKAFEIIHRVKQFGGDLSRPALLTMFTEDKIAELRNELIGPFSNDAKINIWGCDIVKNLLEGELPTNIQTWLANEI